MIEVSNHQSLHALLGVQLTEALRYKLEVREFESRCDNWNF